MFLLMTRQNNFPSGTAQPQRYSTLVNCGLWYRITWFIRKGRKPLANLFIKSCVINVSHLTINKDMHLLIYPWTDRVSNDVNWTNVIRNECSRIYKFRPYFPYQSTIYSVSTSLSLRKPNHFVYVWLFWLRWQV